MHISEKLLWLFGNFFGLKVRQFAQGQKEVFKKLEKCLAPDKQKIWIHVSSLGEYEQGLPVIEELKKQHPDYQVILSFFSPSGYEIKKDDTPADCVVYLPVPTRKNARKFLDLIQPKIALFVKYDFWPNYLLELQKRKIPAILVSGLFYENHSYFKWYNAWLKKTLQAFHLFLVQNKKSKELLEQQGFTNVVETGDTRLNRAYDIAKKSEKLDFVEIFTANELLFVAGSTWPKDEAFLIPYINQTDMDFKTIIAPHQVDDAHIKAITKKIEVPYILYTDIQKETDLSQYKVLILNTIGLLNKVYKYAEIVYIGNGFGKGIHNILEPAAFACAIITGPNIHKFHEAIELKKMEALTLIQKPEDFAGVMDRLLQDTEYRKRKSDFTKIFFLSNLFATKNTMEQINPFL